MTKQGLAGRKKEGGPVLPGGKYEILKAAGRGGAGEVFSVYDRRLRKVWAAKRVSCDCPGMEADVLGRMDAEIFPRIVDVVEDTGCRYLIMDWIEGETLQERMNREGALEEAEGIRIGIALCSAIGTLHAMQPPLLYLDCKPSNIMIDKNGKLRLIDFGSALESRETEVMPIAGSFGYGAPEQFGLEPGDSGKMSGKRRADERSDIYGVGRTLYALLTGMDTSKPPYGACRLRECNPAVSVPLAQIVEKCVRERPDARYQTMDAVKTALERLEKEKSGLVKRFSLRFITWLLLGLTVWRAWCFYGIAEMPDSPLLHKMLSLGAVLLPAAAARLWQYFAVKQGDMHLCRWEPEPLQSVLRTQKRAGKWLFAVLFGASVLFAARNEFPSGTVLAGEAREPADSLPLCLRDEKLRRLLVKRGCALESAKPVFLELDPALFETGKVLKICVTAEAENGRVQQYSFRYLPCEK